MRRLTHRLLFAGALVVFLAPPALAQSSTYAIQGGRIITLAGSPIPSGTIVIENGLITAVGADVTIPTGATVIDATGLEVYPGLFDAISRMGLTEIGAVPVTSDMRELGDYNPHLDAATAVHPASEHIPVARANGITHTVAAPTGGQGGLAGQGSLINLDGWTVEEMMIEKGVGVVLTWPRLTAGRRFGGFGGGQSRSFSERQEQFDEHVRQVSEWLSAARHYSQSLANNADTRRDLQLEALARVTSREIPLLVGANTERQIRSAVEFATDENVDIVITGGTDAWKVADFLAEHNVPVILGATQSMPSSQDGWYDEAYSRPAKLYAAGVKFAFATFNASSSRNLPYEAAMGVPYGLPHEEALRAVTINGAEILGFGDRLGTIESGKIANLIVTDGDPLTIQTHVVHLFINGELVSTDNRHQTSYKKWNNRPRRSGN